MTPPSSPPESGGKATGGVTPGRLFNVVFPVRHRALAATPNDGRLGLDFVTPDQGHTSGVLWEPMAKKRQAPAQVATRTASRPFWGFLNGGLKVASFYVGRCAPVATLARTNMFYYRHVGLSNRFDIRGIIPAAIAATAHRAVEPGHAADDETVVGLERLATAFADQLRVVALQLGAA